MPEKWHKAMVVFDFDPGGSELESMTRADRHRVQQAATEACRSKLLATLEEAGLHDEVEVPEATPLSMLLVSGSPRAIDEMRAAPGVKEVLPMADELGVDLLSE